MFSWSTKKETKKRERKGNSEENEFGIKLDKGPSDKELEAELKALAGIDELPVDEMNLNEDEDEETELLRLIGGGGGGGGKGKKNTRKPPNPGEGLVDLTTDITAEIEDNGDEDIEVDEDDPDLLAELLELTNPDEAIEEEPEDEEEPESEAPTASEPDVMTVLKERLKMYKTAEAKAKESKESSRARRFGRGIKTIEDLIKKAKAGKAVSKSDIPPEIALNLKPAPPPEPIQQSVEEPQQNDEQIQKAGEEEEEEEEEQQEAPSAPPIPQDPVDVMTTLTERLKLYKCAEAKAKESGETTRARRFSRGIKTIEGLIQQAKSGNPVAVADIPPAVALNLKPAPPPPVPNPEETQTLDSNEEGIEDEVGAVNLTDSPSTGSGSRGEEEPERNIMDVLSERLQMYKTAEAKATENGEGVRARRFGRGIKTIQDLIRQATAGKPILPADIPPPIALNLKAAPPPQLIQNIEEEDEIDPRKVAVESDHLVKSPSAFNPPLKFQVSDDIDTDDELSELEMPETVLEGLEQRIRIYTRLKEKAREEGNEALVAQNEKILRIYLNAVKTYRSGGYIDVEKLPAPRGCPPIPIPFQIPQ